MLVIAVLLSWSLPLAQAVAPSPLVGRWDAETRSNGGLGIWFELGDQGACSQTVGVMLDGTWSLEGQWVTLRVIRIDADKRRLGLSLKRVAHGEYMDEDWRTALEEMNEPDSSSESAPEEPAS